MKSISCCRIFVARCILAALFGCSILLALLTLGASYLYNHPDEVTRLVASLDAETHLTIDTLLLAPPTSVADDAASEIESAAYALHANGIRFSRRDLQATVSQIQLRLVYSSAFPYVQLHITLVEPDIVVSQSNVATTSDFSYTELTRYLAWTDGVRFIRLKGGKLLLERFNKMRVTLDGYFGRSSTDSSAWVLRLRANDLQENYYEAQIGSYFSQLTGERITSVAIDDALLVRQLAVIRKLFIAGELDTDAVVKPSVRANAHITTTPDGRDWRAQGTTLVNYGLNALSSEFFWHTTANLIEESFFLQLRNTQNKNTTLDIHFADQLFTLDAHVGHFDLSFLNVLPWLQDANIKALGGSIRDATVRLELVRQQTQVWRLVTINADMLLDAITYRLDDDLPYPYFSGITGKLKVRDKDLIFDIDTNEFTLHLPQIFAYPLIFSAAQGRFVLRTNRTFDALTLIAKQVQLVPTTASSTSIDIVDQRPDAAIQLDLLWNLSQATHKLILGIQVQSIDVALAKRHFFPTHLLTGVSEFIDSSLQAGLVQAGHVDLSLNFNASQVAVDVGLEMTQLAIHLPHMPPIIEANAYLYTANDATSIFLENALMAGIELTEVDATITHDASATLTLTGDSQGQLKQLRAEQLQGSMLADVKRYLQTSPLRTLHGEWSADVNIHDVLGDADPPHVVVDIDAQKWHSDNWYGQRIKALDAQLRFDTHLGIKSVKVSKVDINSTLVEPSAGQGANHFLLQDVPLQLNHLVADTDQFLTGEILFDAAIEWRPENQTIRFTFTPDWHNVAVNTSLFNKPNSRNWMSSGVLEIVFGEQWNIALHGFVEHLWFDVTFGADGYKGCVLFDDTTLIPVRLSLIKAMTRNLCARSIVLERGQRSLPNFSVLLRTESLDYKAAMNFMRMLVRVATDNNFDTQATETADRLLKPLPEGMDYFALDVAALQTDRYPVSPLALRLYKVHTMHTLTLESNWITGTVQSDSRHRTISGHLTHLLVESVSEESAPLKQTIQDVTLNQDIASDIRPSALPRMSFKIDHLFVGSRDLGVADIRLEPTVGVRDNQQEAIIYASSKIAGLAINATLKWQQSELTGAHNTALDMRLLLTQYDLSVNANVGKGVITAVMEWSGSPLAFNIQQLDGEVYAALDNTYAHGKEAESFEALQIIGILNIVEIADLLQLDPDKAGALLLKRVTLRLRLARGTLDYIEPLSIDAIGFAAVVKGNMSLKTGDIDLHATLTFKLKQTLNLAALASTYPAILASPFIGVPLIWLANKILIEPVTSLSYRITGNTRVKDSISVKNLMTTQ